MRSGFPILAGLGLTAISSGVLVAESAPQSQVSFTEGSGGTWNADWSGVTDRTYFAQGSTDLVNWEFLPVLEFGSGLKGAGLQVSGAPGYFFRLVYVDDGGVATEQEARDADFDNDGVSNWREVEQTGTDPLKFSTAGDGHPDGFVDSDADNVDDRWEFALIEQAGGSGSMTLNDIAPDGDFDGDGVSNADEYNLGLSGFQKDSDGDGYDDRLSVDQALFLKLDESAGSLAPDSGGKSNNGALAGAPAWQPASGVVNGALVFHGGSDAVQLPPAALDGLGNFTVSLWFKTSSAANQTLLSGAGVDQLPALAIGLAGGNVISLDTPGSSVAWTYPRSLADGLWHHLVLIRDAGSGQAGLRVDGEAFGSSLAASASALAVDAAVLGQRLVAVSSYDSARAFAGALDEVRIWSAVLAAGDLPQLFRSNDLDQDGLPDDYEQARAGNLTALAGTGNADGDGKTDRQEFETGTDPADYYNGVTPVVTLVSGGGQTIYNGERTPDPLVFLVKQGGTPLANAPLDLSHPELIGALKTMDGNQLATGLRLRTGPDGKVSVHFKAN